MDTASVEPDISFFEFMKHFGTKGMKWGVRNEKAIAKGDKAFLKEASKTQTYLKMYNHMADQMNSTEISRINNDPRFKGRSMMDMNDPVTKAYHEEYSKTATRLLNEAADSFGTNASGTKKIQFDYHDITQQAFPVMRLVDVDVQQSGIADDIIDVEWDEMGHIVRITMPNGIVEDVLKHYGVKGMQWGVRGGVRTAPSPPGSDDYERHRANARAGTKNLSDKDLQALISRMNMESSVKRMNPSAAKKGHAAVKGLLAVGATVGAVLTFSETAGGKKMKELLGKGADKAVPKLPVKFYKP